LKIAIAGYSGLVGSYLHRMYPDAEIYNSKNLASIVHNSYDLLLVSTLPAEKWKANKFPEEDNKIVDRVCSLLTTVKSHRTVVISTVDVYPHPDIVYEDDLPEENQPAAYGRNRLRLERVLTDAMRDVAVIRLPGLVGKGLKKNVLFDLKNGKPTSEIPINAQFQFYPLSRISKDVDVVLGSDSGIYNFATAPITVSEIANKFNFNQADFAAPSATAPKYDVRTSKARLWNQTGDYLVSKTESMSSIRDYLNE